MNRVLFNPKPATRQCIHSEADRSRCQMDAREDSNYCETHSHGPAQLKKKTLRKEAVRYSPRMTFGLLPPMEEDPQGAYVPYCEAPKPRVAVYPGSFNPWHPGHQDVLDKARMVFDEVRVLQMANPDKEPPPHCAGQEVTRVGGLLVDYLKDHPEVCAVVRGLRNGQDLEEAKGYQYWNEDLGSKVPFVHFITDRAISHYSSSAIRALKKFGVAWAF